MTWPVHAATAVLVSKFNPVLGIILAFFSHPTLDLTLEEYLVDWRKGEKVKRYYIWVAWWLAACIILLIKAPVIGRICIIISLAPDIIEVFRILWGWSKGIDYWGKGDNLMPWHDMTPVPRLHLSLWVTILVEVSFVAGALIFLKPGWIAKFFN